MMKQKKSTNSLYPEHGILNNTFFPGEKVIFNGKSTLTVISQRILRNFTTVSNGLNVFEVSTDQLTKINQ